MAMANLYREPRELDLTSFLGTKLTYYPVTLAQSPYLFKFFGEGVVASKYGKEEVNKMSFGEIFLKAKEILVDNNTLSPEQLSNMVFSEALMTGSMKEYIYPCIKECFPDVNVELLTLEALFLLVDQIMNDWAILIEQVFSNAKITNEA